MPAPTRTALTLAAALATLAVPTARAQPISWWDVLSPDRLALSLMQVGVAMVRTQVDLKYSDMSVNVLSNRITVTDLQLWPLPEWDQNGDCEVTVDRLVLSGLPLNETLKAQAKLSAYGITVPATCLPPEARGMLFAARLREISVPYLGIETTYDMASAAAQIRAGGVLDGIAAFDISGDFSYLWFDGRNSMDNPDPVFELRSATLSLENLGGWEIASGLIPPALSDPESAAPMITEILTSVLTDLNREGSAEAATALTRAQNALIASATDTWAGFLAKPQRIVLETGIAPEAPVFLDLKFYEDNPSAAFEDLKPQFSLTPATARATLPKGLLLAALGDEAENLSPEEMLRVGRALATGKGAPRNLNAGTQILTDLADTGNAEAALALSDVLEPREPGLSYLWALRAGAAGLAGATARLDRLEGVLPLGRVLEIQTEATKDASHPVEALSSIAAIKAQARARLTGRGQARSYGIAAMWAMLAAATGDAEAADMLVEIDQRVRFASPEDTATWAEVERRAASLALDVWLSRDLPAMLGDVR